MIILIINGHKNQDDQSKPMMSFGVGGIFKNLQNILQDLLGQLTIDLW